MDQLIDSMRTGEAFNKRGDRGSQIHPNAVLAAEAIEMFSKVNNRRRFTPTGNNLEGSVASKNGAGGEEVNPAQQALSGLKSSASRDMGKGSVGSPAAGSPAVVGKSTTSSPAVPGPGMLKSSNTAVKK